MTRRFAVVHEARDDFIIAAALADRVLVEQIDWLDASLCESQRQWIGEEPDGHRLLWTSIAKRAREMGIRVHGHFDGRPGLPDAQAARRAIAVVLNLYNDIDAIVLIRDADDQQVRRKGLEQARSAHSSKCKIVIGLAICERECWVISGFDPKDDGENERLEIEKQKLGFDPRVRSHELTAVKDDAARKSPKRVLAALAGSDRHRESDCWNSTSLDVLRERGQRNGLNDYLKEVETFLVPLISGYKGRPDNKAK